MQDEYDCIFGIVNYHALTSVHDGDLLRDYAMGVVVDYLAIGLDPKRCLIIKQSDVPQHTELAWLLSTVTPVAWLERCPTYKEKKLQQAADVNFGLLSYPVLMAADIVIYKAELVPVGKDQLPHLELTREIVRAFNNTYGETFPEPQSLINEESAVVLGTDGVKKMSKSVGNTIEIFGKRSWEWLPTRRGSIGQIRGILTSATCFRSTSFSRRTGLRRSEKDARRRTWDASSARRFSPPAWRRILLP
jgi:tryptophanyl-tRNA synthetase